ncbi:MAG TPA: acyl-CoA dehydrogenase family protein [Polyangiaceae bacterium]
MEGAANITQDELIARARALRPVLLERLPVADELRRVPDATIADFHAAGFFRMLQPKRWGGLEVHPRTFFEVQTEIAKGCASSAWVLGVVAVHAWQLGLFAEQAQEDVWGAGSRILISSSYAPTGKIERVPGGFKVSGRWSFSSGCDHCGWVFLGGFAPPPADGNADAPPDMRTYLLPRTDYRIDDTWHVIGLKATGSKDIVVEGAFVPEHRTHRLIDGFRCKSPGNEVNASPLFRLPFGQIFVRSVSTTSIGIAEGALEAFTATAAKRIAAGDQSKVAGDPAVQHVAAEAAAAIDEVKLVLARNVDELMGYADRGETVPLERRVRFRFDSSNAADRCTSVVNSLFTASGGRAIFLGNSILRAFLDVNAARAHYANNPDKPGRNFGGVQLGLKNADFFL